MHEIPPASEPIGVTVRIDSWHDAPRWSDQLARSARSGALSGFSMYPSTQQPRHELAKKIREALSAWGSTGVATWSDLFSERIVFGSPTNEWVGDRSWTAGKIEVLARFERERRSFAALELVDVLVDGSRATVLLRDGARSVTCQLEVDNEGLICRLISFLVMPPGEKILSRGYEANPDAVGA